MSGIACRLVGLLLVLVVCLGYVGAAMAPTTLADGVWLDAPVPWNTPGAAIQTAAPGAGDPGDWTHCLDEIRPPESSDDQAVVDAGWTLFSTYVVGWGVTANWGLADLDGMCRPLTYQVFVFVDGGFAGTISPAPMVNRSDGAAAELHILPGGGGLTATFNRYSPDDALCCPSRKTTVNYVIDRTPSGPVVQPAGSYTESLVPGDSGAPPDSKPRVRLDAPEGKIGAGEQFEILVEASDPDGLRVISWWASGDESLGSQRDLECHDNQTCLGTWSIQTDRAGDVTIYARAADTRGNLSDEAVANLRVRGDKPRVEVTATAEKVDTSEAFTVILRASDGDGLDKIWWWASEAADPDLRKTREISCKGNTECTHAWEVSTTRTGKIVIQARARDKLGNQSDTATFEMSSFNTDPTVDLDLRDTRVNAGDRVRFTVEANDIDGVEYIRVRAVGPDGTVVYSQDVDCKLRERCRQSFDPRFDAVGTVRIRAKAKDRFGKESDDVEKTVRVR